MQIGVLALQGDFKEHCTTLGKLGVEAVEVRLPSYLNDIQGLIIPGGESTTIGKLLVTYGLLDLLKQKVDEGLPVWGTCAGLILLAKHIGGLEQPILGVMDIAVKRNYFGRQVDSFEADLPIPALGHPNFHCVFIRAPIITTVGNGVEVLAELAGQGKVAVREGNLLATAFHPELTEDDRFHRYFLSIVSKRQGKSPGRIADLAGVLTPSD